MRSGPSGCVGDSTNGRRSAGASTSHEPVLSRREFVAGSASLLAASALAVGGCSSAWSTAAPGRSSEPRWIRVSTEALKPGEPRWVEFDVPPVAARAAPAPSTPARPAGTPADSLPTGRDGAWLVLEDDARLVAFAGRCTHRLCLYDWDASRGEFRCRCHPGLFGLDGAVLGGPPPRPLVRFETRPAGSAVAEIAWIDQV